MINPIDPWQAAFIRAYAPACPVCGATLDAAEARCPRCRAHLALGVKIPQIYLAAWGTTLAACALAGGCGLFLLLIILIRRHVLLRGDALYQAVMICNCFVGFFMASAAGVLLVTRRRFCRIPRWTQLTLSLLAIAILLASIISLCLIII